MRPPWSYFDEWSMKGKDQRWALYAQKRRVNDRPNPPYGRWSVSNNRPEGYADYRPGYFYFACEVDSIKVVQKLQTQTPLQKHTTKPQQTESQTDGSEKNKPNPCQVNESSAPQTTSDPDAVPVPDPE